MPAPEQVVLGVDIGTTTTKVVGCDTDGTELAWHSAGYPLEETEPQHAVQDPDLILAAVQECVAAVVAELAPTETSVAGLCFSAAMHSLIGLDARLRPLTPSVTWADTRASDQAERLRSEPAGLELHRRTGTPIHPMSPLPKLVWFGEHEPDVTSRVRHWVGIKEYVLSRLTGELVVDHSMAASMGLLDMATLDWDPTALAVAGITPDRLPPLAPTSHVLPRLDDGFARSVALPTATPIVLGASDGPLANLGVGAVQPGVAACSIGTSGALRVMVEKPSVDPLGRVFCYPLTENRWVVGGAINNGGIVLQWAGESLAPDLGPDSEEALLELAGQVPVGSGGLLMLPYLLGERAPYWSTLPRGTYVGLTRTHRRQHLVRAALEGVCLQLALVEQSMKAAGNEIRQIRATGGFARSPLWRQLLADALGMPIGFPEGHQGSGFGAALFGMAALGLVDSIDVAVDLVQVDDTVEPEPDAAATYESLLPVFEELYDALVPTLTSLRRLAADLPIERL